MIYQSLENKNNGSGTIGFSRSRKYQKRFKGIQTSTVKLVRMRQKEKLYEILKFYSLVTALPE